MNPSQEGDEGLENIGEGAEDTHKHNGVIMTYDLRKEFGTIRENIVRTTGDASRIGKKDIFREEMMALNISRDQALERYLNLMVEWNHFARNAVGPTG